MPIGYRRPNLPKNAYLRMCQECGHIQVSKNPNDYKNDSWRDVKCKKCKSEALDYGTYNEYWEDEE